MGIDDLKYMGNRSVARWNGCPPEALKKLGSIVQAMENDDLPLEKLLTQYEEGMRMFQTCQTRLAAAEVRIQQIERDSAGRIQSRPLDIAPTNPEL